MNTAHRMNRITFSPKIVDKSRLKSVLFSFNFLNKDICSPYSTMYWQYISNANTKKNDDNTIGDNIKLISLKKRIGSMKLIP